MRKLAAVAILATSIWLPAPAGATATCHAHDGLPDTTCTPGDRDTRVTQDTINTTICVKGWSTSVRPVKNITEQIKRERMAAYGVTPPMSQYELDHLIPLELGGASTVANLWPELWSGPLGAHEKDRLEDRLHSLVCTGRMSLDAAQQVFATDWVSAYHQNFG